MTDAGMKLIDEKAERYARGVWKSIIRATIKIILPCIKQAYKDGYTRCLDEHEDFCAKDCKLWDSPFRCRDCTK